MSRAKPCAFYLSERGCKNRNTCQYSHNVDEVTNYYKLHPCKNYNTLCNQYTSRSLCNGCFRAEKAGYKCLTDTCENRISYGRYCDYCYQEWKKEQQEWSKQQQNSGGVACEGYKCSETTVVGRRFCESCTKTNDRYVIRRY